LKQALKEIEASNSKVKGQNSKFQIKIQN